MQLSLDVLDSLLEGWVMIGEEAEFRDFGKWLEPVQQIQRLSRLFWPISGYSVCGHDHGTLGIKVNLDLWDPASGWFMITWEIK
jgi:hypothetical protein